MENKGLRKRAGSGGMAAPERSQEGVLRVSARLWSASRLKLTAVGWFVVVACCATSSEAHWPWTVQDFQDGPAPTQRGDSVVHEHQHGHRHVTWAAPDSALSVLSAQRADPNKVYEITILFFYTLQFGDDFRDLTHMEDEIEKAVGLLNLALDNSHVNANFRIVGIERHPAMPHRQFRAEDWIVNDRRAKSRRDELGADIVYALVDDPTGVAGSACQPGSFTPSTGEQCFYGSVNNWTPSIRAFDNENIWQTILRHEVGHNLGIQHSPEFGGDPRGGFHPGAVGYTVTSGDPWFGTVMGGNELPRFSTSSERFGFRGRKNLVVGEPGIHEASTALLYSIGPVSNYRAPAPPSFSGGTGIPDQRWEEDVVIEPLMLPAAGGGDGKLTYSLSPAPPAGVAFDDSSRTLSGRPTTVTAPTEYTYTATDPAGASASLSFTIEVVEPEANCRSSAGAMCLQDSRYEVTVDWWTADGRSGAAQVADVGTADSGLFWFFDSTNWELLVKVLDGCAVNNHHWVFGAAPTDVGFQVTVTDTESGKAQEYRNEAGQAAPAIADVAAFSEACSEAGAASSRAHEPRAAPGQAEPLASHGSQPTGKPNLVLQNGRFDVRVQWTTEDGESGPGSAASERTVDSGLFWFFEPSNWEMLVKVLDGCALNDHYWMLAGSATTLGFEITVEDTKAGGVRRYTKTDRRERAAASVDVAAFPCSP